jgi:curved DNA-binding protein CbpA
MKKEYIPQALDMPPHSILGISENSGAEEIRSAYLEKIKKCPPDRAPEAFERIRDAYEMLNDPRRLAAAKLFSGDPQMPFCDLLENEESKREFTGPGPWLAAMEK